MGKKLSNQLKEIGPETLDLFFKNTQIKSEIRCASA